MTITTFWGTSVSLMSSQPGWVTPSTTPPDNYLDITPSSLDPEVFRTWDLQSQLAYIQKYGPDSVEIGQAPASVTAAIAPDQNLTLKTSDGQQFTVQGPGRDATPTELATAPADLDPATFLAWTQDERIAYLTQQGSPLVIGGSSDPKRINASLSPDVAFYDGPILSTSGDYQPIPYDYLSGGASGTPSAINQASAEKLFPRVDGETTTLPVEDRPAAFYTTPDQLTTDAQKTAFLKSFSTWHTGYQLEYIKKYGTNGVLDIQVNDPPSRMTAVVSVSDPTKVIIVQSLDKKAIAKLTLAEQNQIAALPAFAEVAASLGVAPTSAARLASVNDPSNALSLDDYIGEAIDTIRTKIATNVAPEYNVTVDGVPTTITSLTQPPDPTAPGGGPYVTADGGILKYVQMVPGSNVWTLTKYRTMPSGDQQPFITELNLLKQQLDLSGIASPQDIQKKVTEIRNRFDRAFAFYNIRPESTSIEQTADTSADPINPPIVSMTVYHDVISLDGNAAIKQGYKVFIAQEKKIAEIASNRMQLAQNGGIVFGKKLDVPSLVAQFQVLYQQEDKAKVVMETEEINQQNEMLKTYAAIQDLVNQTIEKFQNASDDPKGILDLGVDDYNKLTEQQKKILSMFEDYLGTGQKHPLETLRGIDRPLFDFFQQDPSTNNLWGGPSDQNYDLNKFSQPQWSTFGTRLSQAVTLINQNTQIKMNDVNTQQKEADRHFDLASSALSKMMDIIQNIARI